MQAKETTPDITLPFRQCRHRMFRHRMNRHRMLAWEGGTSSLPPKANLKQRELEQCPKRHKYAQPSSTPKLLVRRELRPPFKGRCVNQKSSEPHLHFKRTRRRGKRSSIQTLMHTCNRRQRKATHRREFRRVRACWKASAKHPAQHSLAQERILAETLFTENMQTFTNTKPPEEKQPDPKMIKISTANGKTLRLGVFNVRGMNFISGRQQLMYLMKNMTLTFLPCWRHMSITQVKKRTDNILSTFLVQCRTKTDKRLRGN